MGLVFPHKTGIGCTKRVGLVFPHKTGIGAGDAGGDDLRVVGLVCWG